MTGSGSSRAGETGSSPRSGQSGAAAHAGHSRLQRAAEIAAVVAAVVAIVGVVVAILAWQWPQPPPSGAPTASATGGTSSDSSGSAVPPGDQPTTAGPPAVTRYLTQLTPAVGESFVRPAGPHAVSMQCGTNTTNDRYREVEYDLVGSYRAFSAVATSAGPVDPKSTTQIDVFVDGRLADRKITALGTRTVLAVDLDGASRLTLGLACKSPAMSVTFADAGLSD